MPKVGRGAQQHVEIGLGEIGLPGIDGVNHARVGVDTDHLDAAAGKGRRRWQADIAEADDTHRPDRVIRRSPEARCGKRVFPPSSLTKESCSRVFTN